jgi:hypothetical protein
MGGTPIKHTRNRLVREAILRGAASGQDPVDFLEPFAGKLREMGLAGDLGALREIFDRIDGKVEQAHTVAGDPDAAPIRNDVTIRVIDSRDDGEGKR